MWKKIGIVLLVIFSTGWLLIMHACGMMAFTSLEILERGQLSRDEGFVGSFFHAEVAGKLFTIGMIWLGIVILFWAFVNSSRLFGGAKRSSKESVPE